MEKIKVDMTAKPEVWTDVALEDGTQVKIRNYLPYAEREEAAAEYAARALVVADEENGIVYDSYRMDIEWDYVMVKYYTNINVNGIPTEDVFDYAGGDKGDRRRGRLSYVGHGRQDGVCCDDGD